MPNTRRPTGHPVPLRSSRPAARSHVAQTPADEPATDPGVDPWAPPRSRVSEYVVEYEGRTLLLEGLLVVGRGPDAAFRVDDPLVSQRHACVERTPSGYRLRDLGSRNGTFVGSYRVGSVELVGSTEVRVGQSTFRIAPRRESKEAFVACDPAMTALLSGLDRGAATRFSVLIEGESGVGKEALARRVHDRSARARSAFVAWNAGCIEPTMAESQLFGHVRGAFTGAVEASRGAFVAAHGGTLFLDEIAELPLTVQARLLRVLETGEVRALGAESARRVDVRVVAATHRDLARAVREGAFREDLYFRLAQLRYSVPPLRERRSELPALAESLLARDAGQLGEKRLCADALARLAMESFPGNVRELRNVLIAAALAAPDECIRLEHVVAALARPPEAVTVRPGDVEAAVANTGGNVARAARLLGVPRSTLRYAIARGSR